MTYNPDEPIIIADENVTIKAMAVGHDLAESEVSEFTYSLKKTALGYQMPTGWAWISHNLEEPVATSKFETNAERIVSQTAEMIKDPNVGFIGNLPELLPAEGYKVKVTADTNNSLSGFEFNAHENAVRLASGWNWIGYPLSQIMTLDEALAFFTPSTGDYLVGQDGYAEYVDNEWKGTLEAFVPGHGYLYKSATQTEISFNTTIVSNAVSQVGKRMAMSNSPWAYNKYGWQNQMPLTAQLYVDGIRANEDDYIVGAFAGTECRGIGRWMDGRLLMSVYGEGGEDIRFVAAEQNTDKFYDITNETLKTVGPILFVTAAGGVLGKVISSSDMVNYITSHAEILSKMGIFFPFILAAILKSAQGSSTVALTTTAGIVAPLLPVLGLGSPMRTVLACMAIGAGAMTVSHANDSYFWVVTNFGAMTPEQGYKTQTMCTLVIGIAGILEVFLLSLFLH